MSQVEYEEDRAKRKRERESMRYDVIREFLPEVNRKPYVEVRDVTYQAATNYMIEWLTKNRNCVDSDGFPVGVRTGVFNERDWHGNG